MTDWRTCHFAMFVRPVLRNTVELRVRMFLESRRKRELQDRVAFFDELDVAPVQLVTADDSALVGHAEFAEEALLCWSLDRAPSACETVLRFVSVDFITSVFFSLCPCCSFMSQCLLEPWEGEQAQIRQTPATFHDTDHPWLDRMLTVHRFS